MDGCANIRLPFEEPDEPWPVFDEHSSNKSACVLDIQRCWPIGETRSDEIFKIFAFGKPDCGDCLIVHLVEKSGHLGLKDFLPPQVELPEKSIAGYKFAHLPLENDWRRTNFSLSNVASLQSGTGRPFNTLTFARELLQRYAYVIGDSPGYYLSLQNESTVRRGADDLVQVCDEQRCHPGAMMLIYPLKTSAFPGGTSPCDDLSQ